MHYNDTLKEIEETAFGKFLDENCFNIERQINDRIFCIERDDSEGAHKELLDVINDVESTFWKPLFDKFGKDTLTFDQGVCATYALVVLKRRCEKMMENQRPDFGSMLADMIKKAQNDKDDG